MSSARVKAEIYEQWQLRQDARRLLALESGWLRDWVSQLHGQHLLYAGIDRSPRFIHKGRLQHAFQVAFDWQQNSDCSSRFSEEAWPLPDNSLDVAVLQHTLDLSSRPHQIIREAARTVVPGGYIILAGFNPYSLWGLTRLARTFSTQLPWVANPVSEERLKDWLTLLDFRIEHAAPIAHVWPLPVGGERLLRRIDRVLAGNRWLPANAYIIVARKTVAGMTTIRPRRWLGKESFGLQPVATRVSNANREVL